MRGAWQVYMYTDNDVKSLLSVRVTRMFIEAAGWQIPPPPEVHQSSSSATGCCSQCQSLSSSSITYGECETINDNKKMIEFTVNVAQFQVCRYAWRCIYYNDNLFQAHVSLYFKTNTLESSFKFMIHCLDIRAFSYLELFPINWRDALT